MHEQTAVYLLHGKGGSPDGTVRLLEAALRAHWPDRRFVRPRLPHADPAAPADASVQWLQETGLPAETLVLGVSLGGLVAAKVQEEGRSDLRVVCISAPTWADGVRLAHRPPFRVALYSSRDPVIEDRTADWPHLADAHDLPWLTHATDEHLARLVPLLVSLAG